MWCLLVLHVSFSLAYLASLESMLFCMPTCLLDNSTIILSLMILKSLKPLLILFFKTALFSYIHTNLLYRYHFLVFVPISCIGTIFLYSYQPLYQYCFPVLKYMIVISTMLLLDTWFMHAITLLLLVITWHMFDITYHLPPDTLLLALWLSYFENHVMLSYIITVICISNTYVLL